LAVLTPDQFLERNYIMRYSDLDKAALLAELTAYNRTSSSCGYKLNLNLTRGKPETAQLALSNDMILTLDDGNYEIDGMDAAKRRAGGAAPCSKLFADIRLPRRGGHPRQHASLQLMYDLIAKRIPG
jgi:hypothetical protein